MIVIKSNKRQSNREIDIKKRITRETGFEPANACSTGHSTCSFDTGLEPRTNWFGRSAAQTIPGQLRQSGVQIFCPGRTPRKNQGQRRHPDSTGLELLDTRNARNARLQVLAEPPAGGPMKADAQILKRWLGMALLVLSFALYGFLLLVPFIPFSAESRIAFSAAVVILAESSFWLSVILLGREAIAKYRKVDWRSLFSRLKRI